MYIIYSHINRIFFLVSNIFARHSMSFIFSTTRCSKKMLKKKLYPFAHICSYRIPYALNALYVIQSRKFRFPLIFLKYSHEPFLNGVYRCTQSFIYRHVNELIRIYIHVRNMRNDKKEIYFQFHLQYSIS